MKVFVITLVAAVDLSSAFLPQASRMACRSPSTFIRGYLDDLSKKQDQYNDEEEEVDDSREATQMAADQVERYAPGSWQGYVEFNEFDGGDGQMGVAGDGNAQLEKFDMTELSKSKTMSAKNAWGRSTGYGDELREKGIDTQRAQQLENWKNQQEVLESRKQQRWMTEKFDNDSSDENWRNLASFGVDRNQDFDLDQTFGPITVGGQDMGVIELRGRMYGPAAVYEFGLKNEFMGFADFRAAFTPETGGEWSVDPGEGSLKQKEETNFIVRFKAQHPGQVEGHLVVQTEDFKKTWKVIGSTA